MNSIKNTFSAGFLTVFVLVLGITASRANEYYDYDSINVWLSAVNPSVPGTFDISSQGYDPNAESILSADVEFVLWDSDSNPSEVAISVGGLQIEPGGTVTQGFSIFGGSLTGQALLSLDENGQVGYQIQWLSGDSFKVTAASLIVQTAPNSVVGVPDGGATVALLGLGLMVLEWGRRKVKN